MTKRVWIEEHWQDKGGMMTKREIVAWGLVAGLWAALAFAEVRQLPDLRRDRGEWKNRFWASQAKVDALSSYAAEKTDDKATAETARDECIALYNQLVVANQTKAEKK